MELTDLDGVGAVTAKKLNDAGILTVLQLTTRGTPELAEITGMDNSSAKLLFRKAAAALREEHQIKQRFRTGLEAETERKDVRYITTGTKALDSLFGNGVELGYTTEVYGEFGSGKTQFSHTIAVRTQLSVEQGGLVVDGKPVKILYIDTENTFRPERIRSIAKYLELDADKVLENIIHAKVLNSTDQQLALEDAEGIIESDNIKLIVVDSAIGLFRGDYIGRGHLSDRQGQINIFTTLCSRLAERYNIAIILTNQVMQDPNGSFGDPVRAIGGSIMAHASTYRVYLKKAGAKRIVRIMDSPHHDSEKEVMIGLNERGVVDLDVKESDKKEADKTATKLKRQATLAAKKEQEEA